MRIKLSQVRLFFFVVGLVFFSGGIGYWFGIHQVEVSLGKIPQVRIERSLPSNKENIDFSLFWDVWDRLYISYLDKKAIDTTQMVYGAIRGMVDSLNDPYTVFLPPSDNKTIKEDLNGSFEGVGIQLDYDKKGQLIVIAPLEGMPAEKAGIKAGDFIVKIDEKDTSGMNIHEAVKLIRGPTGTRVKLILVHKGETEPYEVAIIRTAVIIPSVKVDFVKNVAHLKLMKFGDRTTEEWNKAVNLIVDHQPSIEGIVLDLRNNPGGYLTGSVFISSEFLPSGVVVQQESGKGLKETFSVNRQGELTKNYLLVVLVNEGTASASEIVAGALQEYKRAKIIGEKTFGKGTIQEAQDLRGGSGLHITTARWLLPSGKSVDKMGIVPDFEIKDNPDTSEDEQLEKAIEISQ